ncbi:hypothetical protein M409DRAFT_70893 [Zasmidium cellare ATCC 36951]|uniref:Fe2OG dioxygenase domain-containing protein n=1 Tax=Zasmidium cellare ATCC 36951 TaxID=1080233 RepID=A0A6A6BZY6_ZASCE|nr:uncharacterized protein M409DRAFT_70893 [Zasmidium cellare ATCC 36951]KAF2159568.1 hypothetical protein M409DRAFT_70893 [Zasmidium cellare ATCC 36951]
MTAIPIADISAFVGGQDEQTKRKAAKQLAEAVKLHGCAGITGHGLPETDLHDAFSTMRKLFDLPLDEKMRAPHPDGPMPHRGYLATAKEKSGKLGAVYSTSESEKTFYSNAIDWKETYDIGHEDNEEQKNIWLPDEVLPGFRPHMVNLHGQLATITQAILEGLMLGMDLSEEECKTSYTLLFQESESGLEFQNRESGEYMSASPREGMLYLNIGEFMERFSNGLYPSAMHRVAVRPAQNGEKTIPSRFSIPFFTMINSAESIYPMPSRVEADGKANFEPVAFKDLVQKLFNTLLPAANGA